MKLLRLLFFTLLWFCLWGTSRVFADAPPLTFPASPSTFAENICSTTIPATTYTPQTPLGTAACVNGSANGFPCNNVDLLSFIPLPELYEPNTPVEELVVSDIWGWVNPDTHDEYAIIGTRNGTTFVNVTNPTNPVVEGILPTAAPASGRYQRGIKVYDNHAFIVSERIPHGMQVVDLMQLPDVVEVAHYDGFGNAHNIVMNESSGYAYVVGATVIGDGINTCNDGGLHIVDVRDPEHPKFAGCVGFEAYDNGGYVHDAQCVTYPADSAYPGREICYVSKRPSNHLMVVDVTNKSDVQILASVAYSDSVYNHQSWLTEDKRFLLMDDEFDERTLGTPTTTHIWNVEDITNPTYLGTYTHTVSSAIDHNIYVRGERAFASNYRSGLRVLDITGLENQATFSSTQPLQSAIAETGYFDVYPDDDITEYGGAWGAYVYLPSGNVVVSGMEHGLFVLDPTAAAAPDLDAEVRETNLALWRGQSGTLTIDTIALYGFTGDVNLSLSGVPTGTTATFADTTPAAGTSTTVTITTSSQTPFGTHYLTLVATNGTESRRETFAFIVKGLFLPLVHR